MQLLFSLILLSSFIVAVQAQNVYKTPTGEKYHAATCRYVKNVSHKLTLAEAKKTGLSACMRCFSAKDSLNRNESSDLKLGIKPGEAQGAEAAAQQCKGLTKKQVRCTRKTRNVNGYCFQHEKD